MCRNVDAHFTFSTRGFDLRLLLEAILYSCLSFGSMFSVRCPEIEGCLYLEVENVLFLW